jgi:hypothetical protein
MKNIKFLLLFTVLITIFNSCSKAPCETTTCYNNGVCIDGSCDCPDGYSGEQCQNHDAANGNTSSSSTNNTNNSTDSNTNNSADDDDNVTKDACEYITCLNGGSCANGECNCPEGYTGSDCSQQVTPTKIRIKQVDVTSFPATNDKGSGWDLTSAADIYIKIYKDDTELYNSSTYIKDAISSYKYEFELSPNVDLLNPNDQYTIILYDYDSTSGDDYMGGIIFKPYSNTNSFPTTMNLDAGGGITMTLHLSYVW